MSTVKSNVSPLHINCTIGQPYGNPASHYACGFHTGIDFPETGTSEKNPELYACVAEGVVVYVQKASTGHEGDALGNQVQILDNKTGIYYRYCHMLSGSISLQVGDIVTTNTIVRKNGEYRK